MLTIHHVLIIIAAVLFALAALEVPVPRLNLTPLGLFFLTLGILIP